jgi:uracil-DNA glycosylase family 4
MRRRDLTRYCRDVGWRDAPDLPEKHPPSQPQDLDVEPTVGAPTDLTDCTDLHQLASVIAGCTECRLCEKRRKVVPGEGDSHAEVMLIGEGPGAEEDRTGRPFVGQAGGLLDGMIFALGFDRGEVFIGNVVKCRPPGNRDPQDDEMAACAPFLDRQIELIRPRIILALGRVAVRRLTGSDKSMGALRGRWAAYRGTPLMATYHPAYLLRNPMAKRDVWQDLKAVRKRLDDSPDS